MLRMQISLMLIYDKQISKMLKRLVRKKGINFDNTGLRVILIDKKHL